MRLPGLFVAVVALGLCVSAASAQTFTAAFPSPSSTAVDTNGNGGVLGDYCCFLSVGDSVTQTYTGTGLSSVDGLSFSIPVSFDFLAPGQSVDFNVLLNGTLVGTTSWSSADGTATDYFSASFAGIAGAGDSYTVEILETNDVPHGEGSIGLNDGSLTLSNTLAATPEPGTIGLFSTSLAAIGLLRRRRQAS